MDKMLFSPGSLQIFTHSPKGVLLCVETSRGHLSLVQESLSILPVHCDQAIYCLDGINAFDPYPFAQFARQSRVSIEETLDKVRVSRSFTIHQLRASVERLLPPLLDRSPMPLVVVLGIEHLFLEDSLPLWECEYNLRKTMEFLGELRDQGLPVLVTYQPESEPWSWWRQIIESHGDEIARLKFSKAAEPYLAWTKSKGEQNHGKNSSDLQHIPSS